MTVDSSIGGAEGDHRSYETEWTDFESPSTAVVVAVAEATGRDEQSTPVLNDYIDGDALDALVSGSSNRVEISFTYDDATVHVSGSGRLVVETYE
ncbi:HalOD1 output domain-containing protein [Halobaculum sp. EA56]|uniref:HalOD1 output domain-containing protein n=1 Tax=Halobaculum sp. EA56 TaxID=3421648 RepID=UPI003EB80A6D